MATATETISTLPPLQRRMAEAWLTRFEEAWQDQKLKECMKALPPQSTLRKPLLLAMIERDIALNWKNGRAVATTDYLKEFPELGTIDDVPVELIFAEYRAREQNGDVDILDFAERYPTRIDDLYVLIKPDLFDNHDTVVEDQALAQASRRLQLLRTPADSSAADPIAARRVELLKGISAADVTLPEVGVTPHRKDPAPTVQDDSIDMFLPPEPARSEPMPKVEVGPAEAVWLDVQTIRDQNPTGSKSSTKNGQAIPPMPPPVFGQYSVEKRLGRSGLGSVYLAIDSHMGRRVAIKIPHYPADDEMATRARFHREARASASLWHPLLCPILDVSEIDGIDYLTMPYLEGEALSEVLIQRPVWPVRQAVDLVLKLASALDAAHRQGVVHRDLKPSNIMLTPSETPVIVGFGQSFRPNSSYRTDNVVYIAPEQLQSSPEQVGPRADVYSLGAIFYQLLTGRLPTGKVADLEFAADLDPSVVETSRKALAPKPDDRYQSMREFVAALMQIRQPLQRSSEADLRMPLSASHLSARLPGSATGTPLPFGGPPSFSPTGGAPSATFSQVQELRQLSGTYHVGADAPARKSPYRKPQPWRWLILGVVGGLALVTTLMLLSGRGEKANSDQRAFSPDAQSKEQELASEKARLIKDLNDQKLEVRRASAEKLRDFPGDDVSTALAERISDDFWPETREDNGSDRTEALLSLRLRNKSAIPEALESAMKSTNDRVRIWACLEIVHAADPKLEPALIAALKDPNGRVRMLASEGLRQLRWDTKPVIDALAKRISEPWVSRPSNPMNENLSDPRNSGRESALEAFVSVSPDSAEAVLSEIVKNKSGPLQQWANQFLGRLQVKKPAKK